MNDKIKRLIKKTPVYSAYRNIKLIRGYAIKYNLSVAKAIKEATIVKYDVSSILEHAKIKNVGIGDFYYSLDHTIVVRKDKALIENMPVDYGYLLNKDFGDSEIEKTINAYVKRINDPRITLEKPNDLKSALQAILFWNSLLWQTGHKLVGLGRLDKVLESYEIPSDAENLICDFLRTLHSEYAFKSATLMGDTGQIILLGGVEKDGTYYCNEYTKLFIKCLKQVHLPDPKVLLRCSKNMPTELLDLAMDCCSTGIGSPLFSNDDVVIPNLIDFGYEEDDAYNYGVSACWEPLSIGNSLEQNNLANIEYGKCINETILDERFVSCKDIDSVLEIYIEKLNENCKDIIVRINSIEWQKDPLLSYMMGLDKDIAEGGAKYNNYGILSVGMSSAVNSILNINKFVFSDHKYTLKEIQEIIRSDYKDKKEEFSVNSCGFGTDNSEAIDLTNYLIKQSEEAFKPYRNKFGGKVKFGLSSPSYIDIGKTCGTTLDGRRAGESFPTHISRDKGEPLTEILNFESKLSFSGISSNANVIDVMVPSSLIKDNISKFSLYLKGGIREGIFQLQMNVLSYAQLLDAKAHPEKYPNLIVRVWGFSAYFNDLPEEYKDNLIKRAKEMEMAS